MTKIDWKRVEIECNESKSLKMNWFRLNSIEIDKKFFPISDITENRSKSIRNRWKSIDFAENRIKTNEIEEKFDEKWRKSIEFDVYSFIFIHISCITV